MSYEDNIRRRREENRHFLSSLGISNLRQGFASSITSVKSRFSENSIGKASKVPRQRATSSDLTPSRRSNRLLGMEAPKYADIEEIEAFLPQIKKEKVSSKYSQTTNFPSEKIKKENVFGAIPGVPVGSEFITRLEASQAGIHRPPVAGIHGNPALGCYSIALSGGYEDDVDLGESFIYTGEGGRDLKGTKANPKNLRTAAQSKDQVLARGNLALSKNIENNVPVRVLRGYKLNSKYAPDEGYRYDGLYRVVEYYLATGKSGFGVYKFRFERLENQEPWLDDFQVNEIENSDNAAFLSEQENLSNNTKELCKVEPLCDKISNGKMELDEGTTFSGGENLSNKMKVAKDTSLFDKENVSNDKIKQDDISLLETAAVNDIK